MYFPHGMFDGWLQNKLLAYWNFEDNSDLGRDVLNRHNLTKVGTVTQVAGKINNSIAISNNNSYLGEPTSDDMSITGDRTFCFWGKFANDAHQNIFISKFTAGLDYLIFKPASVTNFRFRLDTNISAFNLNSSTIVSPNIWYFVAAWVNFSNSRIYIQVDNGAISSTSYSGTPKVQNIDFRIHDDASASTDCTIDSVGVWKRILSTHELNKLYNNSFGKSYPFT